MLKLTTLLLAVSLLLACASVQKSEPVTYNQNSWQTMIPDSCTHFFDGCNKCTRAPGAEMAACTRIACMEYQKPECLDAPE